MGLSRRSVLCRASAAICVTIAGCGADGEQVQTDPTETTESSTFTESRSPAQITSTRTGSPTPTVPPLTFEAEVLSQPSNESPAKIFARIINTGSEKIELVYGDHLLIADDRRDVEWPEKLVLEPASDAATTHENGCWRPTHPTGTTVSIARREDLKPGEDLSETFVLMSSRSAECLSPGVYRFQDAIAWGSPPNDMIFTLVVAVDSDTTVTARGGGIEFYPDE